MQQQLSAASAVLRDAACFCELVISLAQSTSNPAMLRVHRLIKIHVLLLLLLQVLNEKSQGRFSKLFNTAKA
jgi:hypothetical protein